MIMQAFFKSHKRDFTLLQGDCCELLRQFDFYFDMIFADPPYFLSNGGITVHSGKVVCVDKGEWDKGGTNEYINEFNRDWISACRDKLKDDGVGVKVEKQTSITIPKYDGIYKFEYATKAE